MPNPNKRAVIQTALINLGLKCASEILPEGYTDDQEETLIWLINIVSIDRSILTTDDIEKMVRLIVENGYTKTQISTIYPALDYLSFNYNQKTLTWLKGIIHQNRSILTQCEIDSMVALVEVGGTEALIRTNHPNLNYNPEKSGLCKHQKRPVEYPHRKDNQARFIDLGFSDPQAVKLSAMPKETIPAALVKNLPQLSVAGFNTTELYEIAKNKLTAGCFETLIDHYPKLLRFGFIHNEIVDIFLFQNAISMSHFIIKTLEASKEMTADKCNFVDLLTSLRHKKKIAAGSFKKLWVPTAQTTPILPQRTHNYSLLFWIPDQMQAGSTTSTSYTPQPVSFLNPLRLN